MGPVLVAYATWCGATKEIAQAIAQTLSDAHIAAEARPAGEIKDISPYRAVVLGTGIHAGQVHPEAATFVKAHEQVLSRMPVAYFVDCLTMWQDSDQNRQEASRYLDALRKKAPSVQPVSLGLFGGALNMDTPEYKKLAWPLRLVMKLRKAQNCDYRDWDKIRAWTSEIMPLLTKA